AFAGAGREGDADIHRRAGACVLETQDGIGVGGLPRWLRALALFIERDHTEAIIPDRTLALGRALRARIETDTGHTPAGEGRLYGIDQCRFAGPVRADQRRHPAQVELLNAEQIPIDDDDAAQRDHAAPPGAGMAVSSRALRAFLSATKLSNEASVSS